MKDLWVFSHCFAPNGKKIKKRKKKKKETVWHIFIFWLPLRTAWSLCCSLPDSCNLIGCCIAALIRQHHFQSRLFGKTCLWWQFCRMILCCFLDDFLNFQCPMSVVKRLIAFENNIPPSINLTLKLTDYVNQSVLS